MGHGAGYRIIHDVQAGVAVQDNRGRVHFHHVGQQFLCLVNPCQHPVVAAVGSVLTGQVVIAAENIHEPHGKV